MLVGLAYGADSRRLSQVLSRERQIQCLGLFVELNGGIVGS